MFETKALLPEYDDIAPDGSEIRLLAQLPGGGLCHCSLPPGAVAKATSHQTVSELWYCLSGRGQVWRRHGDVEEIVDFTPGVSLSIPVGTTFQFRTMSGEPLCFIIATIPPWPGAGESVFEEGVWEPRPGG